jgi:serine phosphatase RsbU (regulator of sigma subunit)
MFVICLFVAYLMEGNMKSLRKHLTLWVSLLVLSCAFLLITGETDRLFASDSESEPFIPLFPRDPSFPECPTPEYSEPHRRPMPKVVRPQAPDWHLIEKLRETKTALLAVVIICAILAIAFVLLLRRYCLLKSRLNNFNRDFNTMPSKFHGAEPSDELKKLKKRNVRLKQLLDELEKDGEAGRRIQFRLLPKSPQKFGGYLFRHMLYPSRYFSGDFLDCFEIDEGHIGFYFADVSGHGLPSSFLTVFLKNLIDRTRDNYKSGNNRIILNPSELLLHVNEEFLRQQFDKHLTLFYGLIDKGTNTLLCASGGQYPFPVLTSAENDVRAIGESAYPLGLFSFAEYKNLSYPLPERFSLTIASDGLLEIMEGKDLLEREAAFMQFCREGEISDLALRKRLDLFKREALPDDVTLLIITKE